MEKFNGLVVSSPRKFESYASYEMKRFLDEKLNLTEVAVEPILYLTGLSIASFSESSYYVMKQLKNILKNQMDNFTYVLKIVPIDFKLETEEEEIRNVAKIFEKDLNENDKWRITLRRRRSPLTRDELLEIAADEINIGIVDLEDPDKYLRIEVMKDITYMSFTTISEISVVKYKRRQDRLEELPSLYAENL
ncbi:MAG: hypothetical protein GF383_14020 [Candidatus Lokiarchaeota archaeon]|nr:hypothetical protein [Candidatus Lokiarchaeota archaeon]MBD3342444.1 hypothetical protein [Candidatus Lokiarchaeota archaeon]